MTQDRSNHIPATPDIEALLASVSATESIVDHLFSLPSPISGKAEINEWDRAVSRRLEIRLANTMRTRLNGGEDRAA
jgi:hypothetical protein